MSMTPIPLAPPPPSFPTCSLHVLSLSIVLVSTKAMYQPGFHDCSSSLYSCTKQKLCQEQKVLVVHTPAEPLKTPLLLADAQTLDGALQPPLLAPLPHLAALSAGRL